MKNEKYTQLKVQSSIDTICGADLEEMELISKFKKGICLLLYLIHIFRKYAWVNSLRDRKRITIANAFQKILDESNRKTDKIWADKGSEFYNRSMKSWLKDNNIEMYSTHNEGKSAIAERFSKNKIY